MSHQSRSTFRERIKAFTLIELLVVIAIISILAAILFPVFARARENARRASCMSNLKQIAMGFLMYAQDYDGKLPFYPYGTGPTSSVMWYVYPYVKSEQVFVCPSSGLDSPKSSEMSSYYSSEYGLPAVYVVQNRIAALQNLAFAPPGTTLSVTLMDAVPEPSKTCLIAETKTTIGTPDLNVGFDRFNGVNLVGTGFNGIPILDRHFDGSNYAFMDGHVKWLKKATVEVPHNQNEAIIFWWPKL